MSAVIKRAVAQKIGVRGRSKHLRPLIKVRLVHPLLGKWLTINQNLGHAQCAAQWNYCRDGRKSDLSNF
jgi:hypothetical protein